MSCSNRRRARPSSPEFMDRREDEFTIETLCSTITQTDNPGWAYFTQNKFALSGTSNGESFIYRRGLVVELFPWVMRSIVSVVESWFSANDVQLLSVCCCWKNIACGAYSIKNDFNLILLICMFKSWLILKRNLQGKLAWTFKIIEQIFLIPKSFTENISNNFLAFKLIHLDRSLNQSSASFVNMFTIISINFWVNCRLRIIKLYSSAIRNVFRVRCVRGKSSNFLEHVIWLIGAPKHPAQFITFPLPLMHF